MMNVQKKNTKDAEVREGFVKIDAPELRLGGSIVVVANGILISAPQATIRGSIIALAEAFEKINDSTLSPQQKMQLYLQRMSNVETTFLQALKRMDVTVERAISNVEGAGKRLEKLREIYDEDEIKELLERTEQCYEEAALPFKGIKDALMGQLEAPQSSNSDDYATFDIRDIFMIGSGHKLKIKKVLAPKPSTYYSPEELARIKKEVKEIYQSEIWKEIPFIKSKSHEKLVKYPKLTLDHCMDFVLQKQPSRDNKECQNVSGKLNELFTDSNKRVLILGEMGSGKSIFTKSLAYQWSQEGSNDFDWVFHLDLSECIKIIEELESKENITCYNLIRLKYFPFSNDQNDILSQLLRLKKVLIIIDGYDEAVSSYPYLTNRILGQEELYYLVCSRPEGAGDLLKLKKYLVVKNIGTAYANFHRYIKTYFKLLQQPSYAKELLDWLEKQEDLMKVCTIPIYLEMLCDLWKCNKEEVINKSYLSKADLYDHFVNNILHQHLRNAVDEGCKVDEEPLVIMSRIFLEELSYLNLFKASRKDFINQDTLDEAYRNLQNKILDNQHDEIGKYLPEEAPIANSVREKLQAIVKEERNKGLLKKLLAVGLLKSEQDYQGKQSYRFQLLSFIEYFAAQYLSKNLKNTQDIARNKYDPFLLLVWKMLANILKNDPIGLNMYFKQLLAKPRDLSNRYEILLLTQCLESCACSQYLDKDLMASLIGYLKSWLKNSLLNDEDEFFISNFSVLPYLAEKMGLEGFLRDLYHMPIDKKIKKIYKKDSEKLNSFVFFRKGMLIKILGEIDSLSDEGITLIFSAWKESNGYLYHEATSIIKKRINSDKRVVAELLKKEGHGEIKPFIMEGWNQISSKSAWEEALEHFQYPTHQIILYLTERLTEVNREDKYNILRLLSVAPTPPEKTLRALINVLKNYDIKNDEIRNKFSLFISHKDIFQSELHFSMIVHAAFRKWGIRKIFPLLSGRERREFIENLLIFTDGHPFYFIDKDRLYDFYGIVSQSSYVNDAGCIRSIFLDLFKNTHHYHPVRSLFNWFTNLSSSKDSTFYKSILLTLSLASEKHSEEILDFLIDKLDNTSYQKTILVALFNLIDNHGKKLEQRLIGLLADQSSGKQVFDIVPLLLMFVKNIEPKTFEMILPRVTQLVCFGKNLTEYNSFEYKKYHLAQKAFEQLTKLSESACRLLLGLYHAEGNTREMKLILLKILVNFSYFRPEVLTILLDLLKFQLDPDQGSQVNAQEEPISQTDLKQLISKQVFSLDLTEILLTETESDYPLIREIALSKLAQHPSPNLKIIQVLLKKWTDQKDLWTPTKEAINYLIENIEFNETRLPALKGLSRVEHIDFSILNIFLKFYSDDDIEIKNLSEHFLSSLNSARVTFFNNEIQLNILKIHNTMSLDHQKFLLIILGLLPNPNKAVIDFLFNQVGADDKKYSELARISLIQALTLHESTTFWKYDIRRYDTRRVSDFLKNKGEYKYLRKKSIESFSKPLGSFADFPLDFLLIILNACGNEKERVHWIALAILNNFSSYEKADKHIKILKEALDSPDKNTQVAVLSVLHLINPFLQEHAEKLLELALDNQVSNTMRVCAFKSLKKMQILSSEQQKNLLNFLLRKNRNLYDTKKSKKREIFQKIYILAWETLSLSTFLENYPIDKKVILKQKRQSWLQFKLVSSDITAIVDNGDQTFSLFYNNKRISISPSLIRYQIIKQDFKKINALPNFEIHQEDSKRAISFLGFFKRKKGKQNQSVADSYSEENRLTKSGGSLVFFQPSKTSPEQVFSSLAATWLSGGYHDEGCMSTRCPHENQLILELLGTDLPNEINSNTLQELLCYLQKAMEVVDIHIKGKVKGNCLHIYASDKKDLDRLIALLQAHEFGEILEGDALKTSQPFSSSSDDISSDYELYSTISDLSLTEVPLGKITEIGQIFGHRKQQDRTQTNQKDEFMQSDRENYSELQVDNHWYSDEEMITLIRHYISDKPEVDCLEPMLGTNWMGQHNTLRDNLAAYNLQRANAIARGKAAKDKILMPVNLNSGHWALLYVIYPQDMAQLPHIYYFDPKGNEPPRDLRNAILDGGIFSNSEIINVGHRVQDDDYNCGPWVVEAAKAIANNGAIPEQNYEISGVKVEHANIMNGSQKLQPHHTRYGFKGKKPLRTTDLQEVPDAGNTTDVVNDEAECSSKYTPPPHTP